MPHNLDACTICQETMESYHTVVKPNECEHKFHAICINIWLARHRSCPLCRRKISLTTQMPWRTLFSTALIISHEMALERATYTYAFLNLMLRRFNTAEKWTHVRDTIIIAAEQFELGSTRLPFLDLTTRTTAKKEKKKWYILFCEFSDETPRTSERMQSAKRWILDKLAFMFESDDNEI